MGIPEGPPTNSVFSTDCRKAAARQGPQRVATRLWTPVVSSIRKDHVDSGDPRQAVYVANPVSVGTHRHHGAFHQRSCQGGCANCAEGQRHHRYGRS
jgi:hypothetical protein